MRTPATQSAILNVEDIVRQVRAYNPASRAVLLRAAFSYARDAHAHQVRKSGDPYFTHPFAVAEILIAYKVDDATIASALLHDTVEDTEATLDDIEARFGGEIRIIVDGLTKMKRLDLTSRKAIQGENFRKLLLAISKDVRVLLVKVADRLHNMRTIGFRGAASRARIAQETMDIYAPLAGRMGMHSVREELEEHSFRVLNPDAYSMIVHKLTALRARNEDVMAGAIEMLQARLEGVGIQSQITARQKRPFSIWRKMERKSIGFEHLSDIIGMRVIVDDVAKCYQVLGLAHTSWKSIPERFKDYISSPKQNDYQALHTTVITSDNNRIELQIRTSDMDSIAEMGIAAHALYKDGETVDGKTEGVLTRLERESQAYRNLRDIIENRIDGDHPEELLENTKLELFADQVFCFTPKGKVIALPFGATVIDFAFAVHTQIGLRCVGCRVNGRSVPLVTRLSNGDEVRIMTSRNANPSASWEHIAITGKARASIRKAARMQNLQEYAALGRQILTRYAVRNGQKFGDHLFKTSLPQLAYSNETEAYAAIGQGHLQCATVLQAMYPNFKEISVARSATRAVQPELGADWFALRRAMDFKFSLPTADAVSKAGPGEDRLDTNVDAVHIVRSAMGKDSAVTFAQGGGVVPGDRIVGILTEGEGITIYPIESPELSKFEDDASRWLDVRWDIDPENPKRFLTTLTATVVNEPGSLADVARLIGESDANIDNVRFQTRERDFSTMKVDLEVWDVKHINSIVGRLRSLPVVHAAERLMG